MCICVSRNQSSTPAASKSNGSVLIVKNESLHEEEKKQTIKVVSNPKNVLYGKKTKKDKQSSYSNYEESNPYLYQNHSDVIMNV
jgi:hypothetical protein